MSLRIKICGLTRPEDVRAAADAGADLVGFIFAPGSPRFLPPVVAREVAAATPPHVLRTGVFMNPTEAEVQDAIFNCGLNLLQFHGEEAPDFCTRFGLMTVKAIRVRDAASLGEMQRYQTSAFLLDTYSAKGAGGTGETFNWELARTARNSGRPIFLAGGLTPENVGDAIRQVKPFGVDVSSGVELSPGRKDHAKIRAFITAARAADAA
jgi:phosphoribosylanthranilate isomerase